VDRKIAAYSALWFGVKFLYVWEIAFTKAAHDGRFADYRAVVDHYDGHLRRGMA
jgi:hypothetical protein